MLDVTVERSKWGRGSGSEGSYLLHPINGMMCCVGFACLAAGLSLEEITGTDTVTNLLTTGRVNGIPEPLRKLVAGRTNSNIATALYQTNDAWSSEATREANLTTLGLEAGIKFTFVD